jgi:hypothetical protein
MFLEATHSKVNLSHALPKPGLLVAAQNLKRQWIGIDISPMPAASWPNACAPFAPAGKRTALESRMRLRRPRLA